MMNGEGKSNDENSKTGKRMHFVPHQPLCLLNECVFTFVPFGTCREQIARHGNG
jgi:hypothetical protein